MIKFNKTNMVLNDYDVEAIQDIIESGDEVNGMYVSSLEADLRSTFEVKYAIACANCTTGLIIAIKASGIQGKSVAVPAFTWFSTPYAITCNYNIPYYVDIDKDTWLMEEFDENYVDAIMPVDIFGNNGLIKTKLPTIYDAAHGFGLQGLGNRGLVEVISFSFTKVVQGMQGGAILPNDDKIAEKCKTMVKRYGKMTEVNAYLVSKSMNSVVMNQEKRFGIIDKYKELLKINYSTQVVPRETNDSVFAILLESQEIRDKIFDVLAKNNIESKIYYQPVVEETDYFRLTLPNTFDIYSRILSLPVYPKKENEVEQICKVINEAL